MTEKLLQNDLYKKVVHPTWFIHTTICLQWLGNQPHFSLFFSALYGTQAPQNVDEIQTLIEN